MIEKRTRSLEALTEISKYGTKKTSFSGPTSRRKADIGYRQQVMNICLNPHTAAAEAFLHGGLTHHLVLLEGKSVTSGKECLVACYKRLKKLTRPIHTGPPSFKDSPLLSLSGYTSCTRTRGALRVPKHSPEDHAPSASLWRPLSHRPPKSSPATRRKTRCRGPETHSKHKLWSGLGRSDGRTGASGRGRFRDSKPDGLPGQAFWGFFKVCTLLWKKGGRGVVVKGVFGRMWLVIWGQLL